MMLRTSAAWSLAAVAVLAIGACTSSEAAAPTSTADAGSTSEAGEVATPAAESATRPHYRIVTLGDSYTLGTGTETRGRDSWPAQMQAALNQRAGMRVSVYNLAQESHPSIQVLEEQLRDLASYEPHVVTLQVGLNDIVTHDDNYAENIGHILDELLLVLESEQIFAITTPDHTLTEWGRERGSPEAVEALNDSLRAEAAAREVMVIDIAPVNERVAQDDSLLVEAMPPVPYPTAKQYAGWAELIGPYVYDALIAAAP